MNIYIHIHTTRTVCHVVLSVHDMLVCILASSLFYVVYYTRVVLWIDTSCIHTTIYYLRARSMHTTYIMMYGMHTILLLDSSNTESGFNYIYELARIYYTPRSKSLSRYLSIVSQHPNIPILLLSFGPLGSLPFSASFNEIVDLADLVDLVDLDDFVDYVQDVDLEGKSR